MTSLGYLAKNLLHIHFVCEIKEEAREEMREKEKAGDTEKMESWDHGSNRESKEVSRNTALIAIV